MGDGLKSGFVFGIEGAWGSGKSSLINLTQKQLRQRPNCSTPQIIEFRPWLVGKREDLLKELFNQISGVVHNVVDHPHAGDARRLLRTYAQAASGLAGIAAAAEVFEIPLAGKVKRILRSTGRKAGEMAELSLGDIKDDLKAALNEAKARIIIFIDDLDRLDPPEVVEVLRLIRSVADFPNVVYVTAYDAGRIAKHLKTALGTDDDGAYMEKIVQVSFRIPKPMTFDLVNWFKEEAARLLEVIPDDSASKQRFDQTVQTWAHICLSTPRDVVRTRNALQLHAVPVRGQVDPGDMVFLQLIRVKFPALFKWVEDYVVVLSSWGDGTPLLSETQKTAAAELLGIIGDEDIHRTQLTRALASNLPGIEIWSRDKNNRDREEYRVFPHKWPSADCRRFSEEQRLASRHHYSLYFSFSVPAGAIPDVEVDAFISGAQDAADAALSSFKEMAQEKRPQGGVLAEVLLARIVERRDRLDPENITAIFEVLGKGMDVLARNAQPGLGPPNFLKGDESAVFGLVQMLDKDSRKTVLENLFKPGMSYSWLCGIIREATFEHGLYGNRAKPEGERLLSMDEFDMIRHTYLDMIRGEEPGNLLNLPYFQTFLHSWQQLLEDTDDEVRNWVAEQSKTEEGLLDIFEGMRRHGPGPETELRPHDIKGFFFDIAETEKRLAGIAENEQSAADVRERASKISAALEDGKELESSFPS